MATRLLSRHMYGKACCQMPTDGQDIATSPASLVPTIGPTWSCGLLIQNGKRGKLGAMGKEHLGLWPMYPISFAVKRYYVPPVKKQDSAFNAMLANYVLAIALLQSLLPFQRMAQGKTILRHSLNQSMAALPYCRRVYSLVTNDKRNSMKGNSHAKNI